MGNDARAMGEGCNDEPMMGNDGLLMGNDLLVLDAGAPELETREPSQRTSPRAQARFFQHPGHVSYPHTEAGSALPSAARSPIGERLGSTRWAATDTQSPGRQTRARSLFYAVPAMPARATCAQQSLAEDADGTTGSPRDDGVVDRASLSADAADGVGCGDEGGSRAKGGPWVSDEATPVHATSPMLVAHAGILRAQSQPVVAVKPHTAVPRSEPAPAAALAAERLLSMALSGSLA
jgi:hypothetical protein